MKTLDNYVELFGDEKRKLFLDDFRWPADCAKYMHVKLGGHNPIYTDPHWHVVRSYPAFVEWITKNGLPDLISFDHDLADEHYHQNMQEGVLNYKSEDFNDDYNKTGFHCAKFLVDVCLDQSLPLPQFIVHSMNPVGTENIEGLLNSFQKISKP